MTNMEEQEIPETLYYYTSWEIFEKIMLNDEFWFCDLDKVNDLREHNASLRPDMSIRIEKDDFKFISFSKRYDNQAMWSHYASKNGGVCIGVCRDVLEKMTKGKFKLIEYHSTDDLKPYNELNDPWTFYLHKHSDWCGEDECRLFCRSSNKKIKNASSAIVKIIFGRIKNETIKKSKALKSIEEFWGRGFIYGFHAGVGDFRLVKRALIYI